MRSFRTGRLICSCTSGYASEVDGLCGKCRRKRCTRPKANCARYCDSYKCYSDVIMDEVTNQRNIELFMKYKITGGCDGK